MSPYIKGRSLTLIAGPASNEKFILTTMIAASISRGVTLIKFLPAFQSVPVLYLSFGAGCAINATYVFERLTQKIPPFTTPVNLHIQHAEITHDTPAERRIELLWQALTTKEFLKQESPRLLIVNNLFCGNIEIKKRTAVLFRDVSDSLRSRDIAIVIAESADGNTLDDSWLASAIHANSHIEILPKTAGRTLINTQSSLFGAFKYNVVIDIDKSNESVISIISERNKYSELQKDEIGGRLLDMEKKQVKIKDMAAQLGIGESMVKKLRRVYGLSKKRTDS